MAAIDPGRVVADLRELKGLTGDDDGAQRVAWTDTWKAANDWFRERARRHRRRQRRHRRGRQHLGHRCRATPSASSSSAATWTRCPTAAGSTAILNVLAGLEVLRAQAPESRPLTLKLVSWADEEGARFGRSLLGSSAAAGTLEPDSRARPHRPRRRRRCPTPCASTASTSTRRSTRARALEGAAAYLELHIEQGPVLESIDKPLGAVLGTFGVERHARALHRRARPRRLDADGRAPRRLPGRRPQRAGVARGRRAPRRRARHHRDREGQPRDRHRVQRHVRALARPARARRRRARRHAGQGARRPAERIAAEEGCEVSWERIWQIEPIPFNGELVDMADAVIEEVAGTLAPAAERTAARRRRDGARHPHRDALRQEPARPEPHQGGGHARGGPGAVGARAGRADAAERSSGRPEHGLRRHLPDRSAGQPRSSS